MSPQRILLIRLSHLGDVVHALPVFHALREAYPEAELGWVTQPEFAGLIEGLPGLERCFHFRRRGGAAAWLELRDELNAFDAHLVVDAQGNLKSAFCGLTAGGQTRLGLAPRDWRERAGALTMTRHAAPADGEHALDRAFALARAAAGSRWSGQLSFDLGLSAAERRDGEALWRALKPPGQAPGARPWLVHLSTGDVRAWPAEHFAELVRELDRRGTPTLVLSGPAEAELGRSLERDVPASRSLSHCVGQRGLRPLAALFTAAAADGAHFVGCDSGPMHLAAAQGLPVTCLSGPQSHLRTGPWPVPERTDGLHRVIYAPSPPPCAPCLRRTCHHAEGPVCMREIEPLTVLAPGPAR